MLFLASLAIGYAVAGRVLRPIGQITAAARRIQATSLSRPHRAAGPQDELKTLADTFDEMLERLDTSFTAQRQFVADASHELRNPLAVIQTNARRRAAGAGRAGGGADPARGGATRGRPDAAARRRPARARPARARAGQRAEVDLAGVVDEVRDELDPLARAHGLQLDASAEPDLRVVADRDAVKRALANLLDNAFRHSPEHGTVRLVGERRNGRAVLSVADDGPGLTTAEQERVFERFWRSDSARSRESGGTGLGLAIVRRIAESHGGEVGVASEPGSGSTFVIRLPV